MRHQNDGKAKKSKKKWKLLHLNSFVFNIHSSSFFFNLTMLFFSVLKLSPAFFHPFLIQIHVDDWLHEWYLFNFVYWFERIEWRCRWASVVLRLKIKSKHLSLTESIHFGVKNIQNTDVYIRYIYISKTQAEKRLRNEDDGWTKEEAKNTENLIKYEI